METGRKNTTLIAIVGIVVVMLILALGTVWSGQRAGQDTLSAVRSVSLLYLDELAGRREQVVAANLNDRITDIGTALELITEADLSDKAHFEAYQSNMKRLFNLERFAFVGSQGLIYTSTGTQSDIDSYPFDFQTLTGPEISILNLDSKEKKVIIAVPIEDLAFEGDSLKVCFMQINMQEMLAGVSMEAQGVLLSMKILVTTRSRTARPWRRRNHHRRPGTCCRRGR